MILPHLNAKNTFEWRINMLIGHVMHEEACSSTTQAPESSASPYLDVMLRHHPSSPHFFKTISWLLFGEQHFSFPFNVVSLTTPFFFPAYYSHDELSWFLSQDLPRTQDGSMVRFLPGVLSLVPGQCTRVESVSGDLFWLLSWDVTRTQTSVGLEVKHWEILIYLKKSKDVKDRVEQRDRRKSR